MPKLQMVTSPFPPLSRPSQISLNISGSTVGLIRSEFRWVEVLLVKLEARDAVVCGQTPTVSVEVVAAVLLRRHPVFPVSLVSEAGSPQETELQIVRHLCNENSIKRSINSIRSSQSFAPSIIYHYVHVCRYV